MSTHAASVKRVVSSFFLGVITLLFVTSSAHAAGADYDGNGFSEIPVLVADGSGTYVWHLFDPASGASSVFTKSFGTSADHLILANWIYPNVTSAGVVSKPSAKSGGRLVWRIRTAVRKGRGSRAQARRRRGFTVRQQVKFLGRPGDLLLTGGDFNGDRIADAVVITNRGNGKHKWGLRGSFFLAGYNPSLNVNRAYFDFGRIGTDRPFFLNPDGRSDWFAVIRSVGRGQQEILLTQPFTQERRSISIQSAPDSRNLPVPVAQDDGRDLLAFYGLRSNTTTIDIRDLNGVMVSSVTVPLQGEITVGNYGPGPGEEIAVSADGIFFIFNPITQRLLSLQGPSGRAADSVNINTIG